MRAGPVCGLSPPPNKPAHQPDHLHHHQHHYQQSASIGLSRGDYKLRSDHQVWEGNIGQQTKVNMYSIVFHRHQHYSHHKYHQRHQKGACWIFSLIFNSFNWTTNYLLSHSFLLSSSLFPSKILKSTKQKAKHGIKKVGLGIQDFCHLLMFNSLKPSTKTIYCLNFVEFESQ